MVLSKFSVSNGSWGYRPSRFTALDLRFPVFSHWGIGFTTGYIARPNLHFRLKKQEFSCTKWRLVLLLLHWISPSVARVNYEFLPACHPVSASMPVPVDAQFVHRMGSVSILLRSLRHHASKPLTPYWPRKTAVLDKRSKSIAISGSFRRNLALIWRNHIHLKHE